MKLTQTLLLGGFLCLTISGCGSREMGPATSVPKVDPKKLEDQRRQSMEKGGLKVDPSKPPEASGQN